jgi:hypothetical protein
MTPGRLPLTLYRGDTYRWRFSLWLDSAQTVPADLSGVTARSDIYDKPGGQFMANIACTVELPNVVNAVLTAADCAKLPNSGAWDLQITYASGDVATVLAGPVNTTGDVTLTATPPALVRASR